MNTPGPEERPIKVDPDIDDLLRPFCPRHGLFDGEVCPLCEAMYPTNIELGYN